MANRGWRYDPLRALEAEEELTSISEETSAPPQPDNHDIPLARRRRLQKMLIASVALNAVMLMICAWQYLRIHRLQSTGSPPKAQG